MLQIDNVTKLYKNVRVVDQVSFLGSLGDRIAIVGANGAGKTTLLEMIATLIKPDQGSIRYGHYNTQKEIREMIGFVPQEIALFSRLTVKEQLSFWRKMSPISISDKKMIEMVHLVGLSEKMDEKLEYLSGGMKQKLNLIVSLLHDPKWIILDEPTVGIDIQSKLEIIKFLNEICKDNKTLLFSSHDLQEIKQLSNKVAYLHNGKLLFFGTFEEAKKLAQHKQNAIDEEWQTFSTIFKYINE